MLLDGRESVFAEFVARYEKVRLAEGRRAPSPRRLRRLPFRAPSRDRAYEWRIRARSFRSLLERVIAPAERAARRPLRVADVGSGLGWLAYRLASRGHDLAAVDSVVNDFDGLGVHKGYDRAFLSLQAEFDCLPFRDGGLDPVVYNASLHYAAEYEPTSREALRVLAPGGRIAIVDTPIYHDAASGQAMVRAREEGFEREHGLRPQPDPHRGLRDLRSPGGARPDAGRALGALRAVVRRTVVDEALGGAPPRRARARALHGGRRPARRRVTRVRPARSSSRGSGRRRRATPRATTSRGCRRRRR